MDSSPTRKVKKTVNYAESSDDDDEDVFVAMKTTQARRRNRTRSKVIEEEDDDVYEEKEADDANVDEDGMIILRALCFFSSAVFEPMLMTLPQRTWTTLLFPTILTPHLRRENVPPSLSPHESDRKCPPLPAKKSQKRICSTTTSCWRTSLKHLRLRSGVTTLIISSP